ncbi:hypothetical protein [Actinomarinicola tropica]|uniref:Uncharacterized protein n=1 Tax=Actinomarinicola tropica TaxID=2789776 RepID=A0A5Q2RPD9_9ACTN|nr:hypothetical protein [Actinomarinicola tropica]QGG95075.1 hypothetical protein GH723_08130 [Actinomarinicola tropica]
MTTNGIEERLRQHVERLDDPVAPITATEAMDRRVTRGRSVVPWVSAAAALLVVVGAVAVVLAQRADDTSRVATAPVDTPGAPPADQLAPLDDAVELWLSAPEVPPGDHEVVAALRAHDELDATFGVLAEVERWDGTRWTVFGEVAMCLDHWHCTAEVRRPGAVEGIEDIGLSASPGAAGPVERFSVTGLEPGWYRISHAAFEGVEASGILRITAGAPPPVPLWPTDAVAVSTQPPFVPTGGATVLLSALVPPDDGGNLSAEDIEAAVAGMDEEVSLERWEGEGWVPVAQLPLVAVPEGLGARAVEVPPLDPGAYRLVREGPGGPHVGNLWVVDPVEAGAASAAEVPRDHEIRLADPPMVVRTGRW